MRNVTVGALNVAMPEPHDAGRYVDLLKAAYRLRKPVKIRGEFAGILGAFGRQVGADFLYGEIFKFFDLQIDGRWLNVDQQAPAEQIDLEQLNVPENLKPGLETFPFLLHPRTHRIFFLSRERDENLGPRDAGRFFRSLLNQARLFDRFGEVAVTVEPDRDTLNKILTLPDLRKLQIVISPPNPDDLEDLEQRIKERLNAQKASKMVTVLVAEKGESLTPDDDTIALSEVAKSNGYVEARGRGDEGNVSNFSTKDHPLLEPASYDPDNQTVSTAVLSVAAGFVDGLLARRRRGDR